MRKRLWLLVAGAIVLVLGTLLGAALLAWPRVQLDSADVALARVSVPRLAGRVTAIEVRLATGELVPTQLRNGDLWPQGKLGAGESLTVQVTVRRPGWAGWLVGKTQRRSFAITTPSVHLLGRWLQVQPGSPVTVAFDCAGRDGCPWPIARAGAAQARERSCRWAWSPAARAAPGRSRSPLLLAPGNACRRRSR